MIRIRVRVRVRARSRPRVRYLSKCEGYEVVSGSEIKLGLGM